MVASEAPAQDLAGAIASPLRFLFGNPFGRLVLDSLAIEIAAEAGRDQWTLRSARALDGRLFIAPDYKDYAVNPPALDPQLAWFRVHANLAAAGALLPNACYRVLRIEDLLSRPEATLGELCEWLGWPAEPDQLAAMQQPEHSLFAALGPDAALYGADEGFLTDPGFARRLRLTERLDGPLEWRDDGRGFADEVRAIASRYGYA